MFFIKKKDKKDIRDGKMIIYYINSVIFIFKIVIFK